ncbi:MAG: hypothetical protein RR257_05685 [Rikenellaceae bacterium]
MRIILLFVTLLSFNNFIYAQNRWNINSNQEIVWKISEKEKPHFDFIESSGSSISVIAYYGVDEKGNFNISRRCVWPMLRIIPNNTHGSFIREFDFDITKLININGNYGFNCWSIKDNKVDSIKLKGYIEVFSTLNKQLAIQRKFFPSSDKPIWCEKYMITNISKKPIKIDIPNVNIENISSSKDGVDGSYYVRINTIGSGAYTLNEGDTLNFGVEIQARKSNQEYIVVDIDKEFAARKAYLSEVSKNLILNTPDSLLNTMFAFAKVRVAESIFDTAGGLLHAPGGGDYYAAIWANDQAEYANPFFPFLGNKNGNASALNSYLHFARFMNRGYKPIPSSIIAEGKDIWNGAGDRGDAAMIGYGASRFALESGNKETAKELWPLIEWCLEYSRRQINTDGVVVSQSDELEGRFPSGEANLCTSSLYYDALISASYLVKDLGLDKSIAQSYRKQADDLRNAMGRYFGATVEGFDTYRYYKGNDVLRAWICMPLSVGIYDKAEGTVDALFSDRLWTADGLATEAGDKTFWDRSTLYALRGIFSTGDTERALEYLKKYSKRRLLGDHVPYAVEAFPEGNQAQLSAESGLYCRIFTEGLFGIRPTGLKSFSLTPRLPKEWNTMSLSGIKAFGGDFSIVVTRKDGKLDILVCEEDGSMIAHKLIKDGTSISIIIK